MPPPPRSSSGFEHEDKHLTRAIQPGRFAGALRPAVRCVLATAQSTRVAVGMRPAPAWPAAARCPSGPRSDDGSGTIPAVPRLLLLSELHPALDEEVAGTGLVGVLPDAGDAIGEPEIAEQARAHLRRAGADLVDIDLDGDVCAQLGRIEVLVVTGGDPAALNVRLRRTGGGGLIAAAVRADALRYVGLSAGSMVAGPSLAPHLDSDPEDLPSGDALRGLGLTDVHVLVHHGRRGREGLHARAMVRHATGATLVPLADADGLRLRDGAAELFGPQRGDRLRSSLPADAPALAAILDDVDWTERLQHPGVVVSTRDGTVNGLLALGKRTMTNLGVGARRAGRGGGAAARLGGRGDRVNLAWATAARSVLW